MSIPSPRPWITYLYAIILIVSLAMVVSVILFITSHCETILESTGTTGTCGLGIGWILFCIGFLVIAGYSGRELYLLLREKSG